MLNYQRVNGMMTMICWGSPMNQENRKPLDSLRLQAHESTHADIHTYVQTIHPCTPTYTPYIPAYPHTYIPYIPAYLHTSKQYIPTYLHAVHTCIPTYIYRPT